MSTTTDRGQRERSLARRHVLVVHASHEWFAEKWLLSIFTGWLLPWRVSRAANSLRDSSDREVQIDRKSFAAGSQSCACILFVEPADSLLSVDEARARVRDYQAGATRRS